MAVNLLSLTNKPLLTVPAKASVTCTSCTASANLKVGLLMDYNNNIFVGKVTGTLNIDLTMATTVSSQPAARPAPGERKGATARRPAACRIVAELEHRGRHDVDFGFLTDQLGRDLRSRVGHVLVKPRRLLCFSTLWNHLDFVDLYCPGVHPPVCKCCSLNNRRSIHAVDNRCPLHRPLVPVVVAPLMSL